MEEEVSKNIELIYDYTDSFVKEQRNSVIRLDTKLSALLAFSGLILKFALGLNSNPIEEILGNSPELFCLLFKISSCLLAAISAGICCHGLIAGIRGISVDPKDLMSNEYLYEESDRNKAMIIIAWIKITDEYVGLGKRKNITFNIAVCFITASIMLTLIQGAIYSVFISE